MTDKHLADMTADALAQLLARWATIGLEAKNRPQPDRPQRWLAALRDADRAAGRLVPCPTCGGVHYACGTTDGGRTEQEFICDDCGDGRIAREKAALLKAADAVERGDVPPPNAPQALAREEILLALDQYADGAESETDFADRIASALLSYRGLCERGVADFLRDLDPEAGP